MCSWNIQILIRSFGNFGYSKMGQCNADLIKHAVINTNVENQNEVSKERGLKKVALLKTSAVTNRNVYLYPRRVYSSDDSRSFWGSVTFLTQ